MTARYWLAFLCLAAWSWGLIALAVAAKNGGGLWPW